MDRRQFVTREIMCAFWEAAGLQSSVQIHHSTSECGAESSTCSDASLTHGWNFSNKLVGQDGSLTGCSAMPRYKNKDLNAKMSTNVTVIHG